MSVSGGGLLFVGGLELCVPVPIKSKRGAFGFDGHWGEYAS